MNATGNVTVSLRSILVAALVLLALLVAYLLGGSGGGGTPAQAADGGTTPPAERRVLTMTGTGDATAVPDQLSFALGVNLTRPDLDAALDAANASMARVLDSLKDYDVAKVDVQTTGLSMSPVYEYHQYGSPTITGYRVSERARVLVKELEDGGAAVSAAVAAGGNDVRVSDMEKARDAAVAEATAKAKQYADSSGQTLGDVMTLREVRAKPLPTAPTAYLHRMTYDAAAKLTALPIRAGKQETSVTVQIVWSFA
jgi:uncharacterized protein YggE